MENIIEIYDNYQIAGIKSRTVTEGEELNLVHQYIDYRKNAFHPSPERKMAIFLEVKVENTYPDIVFVEYNPDNYSVWNKARELLERDDLKILYHLYMKGGGQLSDLVMELGTTWKAAGLSVEKLYDAGLITRTYGKWSLINERQISPYTIQAVEAKINKLNEVLQQSIINKNFASESYALSTVNRLTKEMLSRFKKFGIGLCLKNGSSFVIMNKAKQSSIPVGFNSIMFNEWIGRILNSEGELFNAV